MSIVHPCGITFSVEVFWDNSSWTDMTDDIRRLSIQTCKRSPMSNVFEPGRLVMVVNNRDRKYDPNYAAGTHYGDLKPGRLVRVRFASPLNSVRNVWWGFVDRFVFDPHRSGKDMTTTITCVDELSRAAWARVPAGTTPGIAAGDNAFDRLTQIAATIAVGPEFNDAGGDNFVVAFSGQDRWDTGSDHALVDEIRKVALLEGGPIIPNAVGGIDVWDRNWFARRSKSTTYQTGISCNGGNFPAFDISVRFDADDLVTAIAMTDELGNAVVSIDAVAEADYGTRYPSASYTGLPSLNDEDLEGAAQAALATRASETFRFESVTFKPAQHPDWPDELVPLEVLDRVRVGWTPVDILPAISADYFIDGIAHEITADEWVTSLSLWPCAPFDAAVSDVLFTLDSSALDGFHVLGL